MDRYKNPNFRFYLSKMNFEIEDVFKQLNESLGSTFDFTDCINKIRGTLSKGF